MAKGRMQAQIAGSHLTKVGGMSSNREESQVLFTDVGTVKLNLNNSHGKLILFCKYMASLNRTIVN